MDIAHLLTHCLDQRNRTPCLLLVHEEIRQLHRAAEQVIQVTEQAPFAIGPFLSAALLPVPPAHRASQIQSLLIDALGVQPAGPVLCTALDLLFEPSLSQNPLLLLRTCSRQRPLVVMWPGTYRQQVLAYGQQAHAHYRTWRQPELQDGCIQVIA